NMTGTGQNFDPVTDTTIIALDFTKPVIQITAGGPTTILPLTVQNLAVLGGANGFELVSETSLNNILLNSITSASNSNNGVAIVATSPTATVTNLSITNAILAGNFGAGFDVPLDLLSINNLTISDATITSNGLQGIAIRGDSDPSHMRNISLF